MTEQLCGVLAAYCRCVLPEGHAGAHQCDPSICTGSWSYDANGQFVVVNMPQAVR